MEITNNRYFRVKQDKNTGNLYSVFVLPVNLDAIGTLVLDSKKCKKKRLKSVFESLRFACFIYLYSIQSFVLSFSALFPRVSHC